MELVDASILIVDDDRDIRLSAELFLKRQFERVSTLSDPTNLRAELDRSRPDVVLLDMNYRRGESDGAEGLRLLSRIHEFDPNISVILMTAFGELDLAVKAVKLGAFDFILKPWQNGKLFTSILAGLQLCKSKRETGELKTKERVTEINRPAENPMIWGRSGLMHQLRSMADTVAGTDANVLILGENGTGKEMLSTYIHGHSGRRNRSAVRVDLGTISESLFEAELFGSKKGAYTGSSSDTPGRIRLAHESTLFLDEIGNLPLALQQKLLSVLERREVVPVGGTKPIPVDFRFISATNNDIESEVADGRFREDLFYRINTVTLRIPALRERPEDIPVLAESFLTGFGKKYQRDLSFTREALVKLGNHSWPGNIRELKHVVERAVIMSQGSKLTGKEFDFLAMSSSRKSAKSKRSLTLEELEKQHIESVLDSCDWNISVAAGILDVTRASLYRRMEKHNLK